MTVERRVALGSRRDVTIALNDTEAEAERANKTRGKSARQTKDDRRLT